MHLSKLLLLAAVLPLATVAQASTKISVKPTKAAPLQDGTCRADEWQAATKLELPAGAFIYLMHDKESLYVCAKGKAEDFAVVDVYVEHADTGHLHNLHNLHASAQLGERIFAGEEWSETEFWKLKDWTGFWVPYAGQEETADGSRTKFLKGSHREIQVLRNKFPGDTWKVMINVSALNHQDDDWAEFSYPEKAIDSDVSTWAVLAFAGDAKS